MDATKNMQIPREDNLRSLLRSQNSTETSLSEPTVAQHQLLHANPTPTTLLQRYNPSLQAKALGRITADLSLNDSIPSLGLVRSTYGEPTAIKWLTIQLMSLNDYAGVQNGMTDSQLSELSALLLEEYYYLNLAEFMQFFARFKLGRYGQFYGTVDPLKITSAMQTYIKERTASIDVKERELERERKERLHKQWTQESITYEQWKTSQNKSTKN